MSTSSFANVGEYVLAFFTDWYMTNAILIAHHIKWQWDGGSVGRAVPVYAELWLIMSCHWRGWQCCPQALADPRRDVDSSTCKYQWRGGDDVKGRCLIYT